MHLVTIAFKSREDADWSYKFILQAMTRPRSLGALPLGILQDALGRASYVDRDQTAPDPTPAIAEVPIEHAQWETEGGAPLTCEDCGCVGGTTKETTCPYAADVDNPDKPATLCEGCYQERCNDI